jgi:hypothetical protein
MDAPKKNPPLGRVEKMDREPVLGSGAAPALAYAASWIVAFIVIGWLTHR